MCLVSLAVTMAAAPCCAGEYWAVGVGDLASARIEKTVGENVGIRWDSHSSRVGSRYLSTSRRTNRPANSLPCPCVVSPAREGPVVHRPASASASHRRSCFEPRQPLAARGPWPPGCPPPPPRTPGHSRWAPKPPIWPSYRTRCLLILVVYQYPLTAAAAATAWTGGHSSTVSDPQGYAGIPFV